MKNVLIGCLAAMVVYLSVSLISARHEIRKHTDPAVLARQMGCRFVVTRRGDDFEVRDTQTGRTVKNMAQEPWFWRKQVPLDSMLPPPTLVLKDKK